MLEGLEVSILNLKDVLIDNENKRIDSEYFKKQFLRFFQNIPNLRPLGSLAKDGYRVVYENTKIIDKEEAQEKDFPIFLQATDLETPFIKTDNLFYVDNVDWERYLKGRISKGEILIEVKGKIDKVAIVPDDFPEKTLVSGSLFKLTVNEKISKNTLLTYLISKYGVAFKDRYKTNLLISFVSKPDLYRIPVPSFSKGFENKIDDLYTKIFSSEKSSKQLYTYAENLLLETLGLQNLTSSIEAVNIKSFKESFLATGRLDAEYYQPKYEDYYKIIKGKPYTNIASEYIHITDTFERDKNEYNYIEIGDVNIVDGRSTPNIINSENLPANAKLKPIKGDLLISKVRPYRGAVSIIEEDYENLVVSGAFTVIRNNPKSKFNKEVLKVLLRTSIYKDWLLQFNVGTSYPVIKDENILNLPIPIIEENIQQQIADLIQESFVLKAKSTKLLETAKRAVEIAIEENEEVALEFINKNK